MSRKFHIASDDLWQFVLVVSESLDEAKFLHVVDGCEVTRA